MRTYPDALGRHAGPGSTGSLRGPPSQALQILAHSPLIGRKIKAGERELVIGQDSRGSVALYRFVTEIDTVFVLAIRSQRECCC